MAVFLPEKMNRISVIALKDDLDKVLFETAALRVLHPARVEETHGWAAELAATGVESESAEFLQRERRLQQLGEGLAVGNLSLFAAPATPLTLVEVDRRLELVEAKVGPLLASRNDLADKRNTLSSLLHQLGLLMPHGMPMQDLAHSAFLVTAVGLLPASELPALAMELASIPSFVLPYRDEGERRRVLCIVLRRDTETLSRALHAVHFEAVAAPQDMSKVSAESVAKLERELAETTGRITALQQEIDATRTALTPELATLAAGIRASLVLLRMESLCRSTDSTSLFSGWVPRKRTDEFLQTMRDHSTGRALVEVAAAESLEATEPVPLDIPVLIDTPTFLKPFRALTEGFGVPTYHMIDPTPFVAVTFLLMFGMMFGDVGQGLVLLVAGALLAARSRNYAEIGRLAIYCGMASMLYGLLYGSIFGLEGVIPALWMHPLEHVTTLFATAIGFGVVFISIGLMLNILNSVRRGALASEFFDTAGPLILVAYWAGVGLAVRSFTSRTDAATSVLAALVVIPLALLVAKGPILRLLGRQERAFPEGIGVYLMESVVEILEILMGYVANTVSFIRVAAFGLAHAGLFLAVFGIAGAIEQSPLGNVLSLAVIVLGNLVIILLEGLIVVIQAMRLEYYEFFGKFFKESGTKFEPLGFS